MTTRSERCSTTPRSWRDEEVGEVQLPPQLHEQVQDLRLDGDVERRHRLVADQEVRLHRERAGDADALPLAAGELVRVAAAEGRVEAGAAHLLVHVGRRDRARRDDAVDQRRLADDVRHLAGAG